MWAVYMCAPLPNNEDKRQRFGIPGSSFDDDAKKTKQKRMVEKLDFVSWWHLQIESNAKYWFASTAAYPVRVPTAVHVSLLGEFHGWRRDSVKSLWVDGMEWSGDSPFMYNMFYYIGFIITTLAVLKSKFHSGTGYHSDCVQHTRRDLWFAFHRTRLEIDSSWLTTFRVLIEYLLLLLLLDSIK